MTNKEKSAIQEHLSLLYLRLNGYFTTGYIIHSDKNKINGELDILAVRFPFHKQDYTEHNSSEYLEVPLNMDMIIAEVKSKGQSLQFNNCLKQQETIDPWEKILSWAGVLKGEEINKVAIELNKLVQTKENSQLKLFRSTEIIKTSMGNLTIRPVLFSPERINKSNADKFINWTELNTFIWQCLCPAEIREMCGTRYDFTAWGHGLNEIVKAFKDRHREQNKFVTINDLYKQIEKTRERDKL